jgi:hypothetical protein
MGTGSAYRAQQPDATSPEDQKSLDALRTPPGADRSKSPDEEDLAWKQKARIALEAREMSRSIREGKPRSFRRAVGRAG